jgi:hypothetical protein
MGMIGKLFVVSPEAAEVLVDDPTGFLALLGADHPADVELDLHKTWHCLHFLLTGLVWEGELPLGFLVAGSQELEVDLGYGHPRLFSAEEVKRIAAALANVSTDELLERLDPSACETAEIYGANWDEPLTDLYEEYGDAFDRLKAFVTRAADSGQAMVVAIV